MVASKDPPETFRSRARGAFVLNVASLCIVQGNEPITNFALEREPDEGTVCLRSYRD